MTRLWSLFANRAVRLIPDGLFSRRFTRRRQRSRPRPLRRTLRLEALEDRTLLSPTVLDPNLAVRTVVSLPSNANPTSMVFLGNNDFLLTEKTTGKIDHVINGVVAPTQFDMGAGPIP